VWLQAALTSVLTITSEVTLPKNPHSGERGFRTRTRLLQEGFEIDRKMRDALRRLSEGHLDHGG
jgi:hypothetical protein